MRAFEGTQRIWFGASFRAWLRLLRENDYDIDAVRAPWALLIGAQAAFNSSLAALQELLFARRTAAAGLDDDPIFIIGHWRSGTTWLHDLLTLDPRHTFPTTYECVFPGHFLLTEWYWPWLLRPFMPARRPMDNVATAWQRPQEDEFALCNLGQPSPYLTFAFPNRPQQHPEYFDLERLPRQARDEWKAALMKFLKQVQMRRPGRLVLKSPTHTYRIKTLLELFPDARFVHIVRNPSIVIPSTIHTWKTLCGLFGLQRPTFETLEEQVFQNYLAMFARLDQTRGLPAPGRFVEVRYEDLAADPAGAVASIYERLELGDFTPIRPALERHLAELAAYETNRYTLPDELRETICRRTAHVMERYGYAIPLAGFRPPQHVVDR